MAQGGMIAVCAAMLSIGTTALAADPASTPKASAGTGGTVTNNAGGTFTNSGTFSTSGAIRQPGGASTASGKSDNPGQAPASADKQPPTSPQGYLRIEGHIGR